MKALALSLLSLPLILSAQEEIPPRHMRFIALGEIPVWKETVTDLVRIQAEYEPGQMPPRDILVGTSGAGYEAVNFHLREFSPLFTFSGALESLKIEQGKPEEESEPWIETRMPTAPYTLAAFYRDDQEMTWFKPRVKVVKDDLESFPLGTMRFVNLSPHIMHLRIDEGEPIVLTSGELAVQPMASGGARVQISVETKEDLYQRIFDNIVNMAPGHRVQSFFYKSQNPPPALPVKFFYRLEKFQAPKAPPKKEEEPKLGVTAPEID